MPLYPLWDGLIAELVDAASERLDEREAATLGVLARQSPEEAVANVRQQLGAASYRRCWRECGADGRPQGRGSQGYPS